MSVKKLICTEVSRCHPGSLQKNSFTHRPSCILPSFSQKASQLLFLKRLWGCASKIFFRKYKRKVVSLEFTSSITIHLSHLSSCSIWHLTLSWIRFLSINRNSSFFAIQRLEKHHSSCSDCVFWQVVVLRHGDNTFLFHSDICIKFTLSTILSSVRKW